jgi:hypothetical protein
MLTTIKLLHTMVWAILAGSIVVLPLTGVMRRFRWAAILSGLVLLEWGVLAVNGGRCPLSDLAQRFTDSPPHKCRATNRISSTPMAAMAMIMMAKMAPALTVH